MRKKHSLIAGALGLVLSWLPASSWAAPEPTNGLVLGMNMDELALGRNTPNNIKDFSGNGLHGSSWNLQDPSPLNKNWAAPNALAGNPGTCNYLNFQNKYGILTTGDRNTKHFAQWVEVPDTDALYFDDEYTLSVWIAPAERPNPLAVDNHATATGNGLISKDESFELNLVNNAGGISDSRGRIQLFWNEKNDWDVSLPYKWHHIYTPDNSVVIDGKTWTHVVVTWTRTQQKIYINGNLVTTSNIISGAPYNSSQALRLGVQKPDLPLGYYHGAMDELRIYDRAVSAAEVSDLYNARHACAGKSPYCDTDTFDNLNNWDSRKGSGSHWPRIDGGWLQLTRYNIWWQAGFQSQATAAHYRTTYPANNNLIQVEFDYCVNSAVSGDGIALAFLDASAPIGVGADQGALGYSKGDGGGTAGIPGGWLGVGIDGAGQWGAWSDGKEGGQWSGVPLALRTSYIGVRGSGSGKSGYAWKDGVYHTVPITRQVCGADTHRYRVQLDTRTAGVAKVTVQRDHESTPGFIDEVVIPNILGGGQAALPDRFRLALTGGGASDLVTMSQWVDNFTVCSAQPSKPDHIRIVHDGNANACGSESITLQACADDTCSSLYTGSPVTVTLSGSNGGKFATNPVTFSGSTTVAYTPGSGTSNSLSMSNILPGTMNGWQCQNTTSGSINQSTACSLGITSAGTLQYTIQDRTSGQPQTVDLAALASGASCGSATSVFSAGATANVQFWFSYGTPATGTMKPMIKAAGADDSTYQVMSNNPAAPTTLALSFADTDGNAGTTSDIRSKFVIKYADAGRLTINAKATGPSAEQLTGLDDFVSFPYAFCAKTTGSKLPSCTGQQDSPNNICTPMMAAGQEFGMEVKAVAATVFGAAPNFDLGTDQNICDNPVTTNFQGTDIRVAPYMMSNYLGLGDGPRPDEHIAHNGWPTKVSVGTFKVGTVNLEKGVGTITGQSYSEVGEIRLSAGPYSYMGATIPQLESERIGHFYPKFFTVAITDNPDLANNNGTYSYRGLPVSFSREAQVKITAHNADGVTTLNYDLDLADDTQEFWKLSPANLKSSYRQPNDGGPALSTIGAAAGATREDIAADQPGAQDGARTFRLGAGTQLVWTRNWSADRKKDAPRPASYVLGFPASALTVDLGNGHVSCYSDGLNCADYDPGTAITDAAGADPVSDPAVELRLARALLDKASGSESKDMALPLYIQYWTGNSWAPLANHNIALGASYGLARFSGGLQAGETSVKQLNNPASNGVGSVVLSAPGEGNGGAVELTIQNVPDHVKTNNDSAANNMKLDKDPSAEANFGLEGGQNTIYRQEQMRTP